MLRGAAAKTYHVLPALETPDTALAYDVAYGEFPFPSPITNLVTVKRTTQTHC